MYADLFENIVLDEEDGRIPYLTITNAGDVCGNLEKKKRQTDEGSNTLQSEGRHDRLALKQPSLLPVCYTRTFTHLVIPAFPHPFILQAIPALPSLVGTLPEPLARASSQS